jgi:hypothetical protein
MTPIKQLDSEIQSTVNTVAIAANGDRRMTADEALALAESDQYSSDPVVGTLAAEVERLRADNSALQMNLRKFSELVTSITGELDWFKQREEHVQEMKDCSGCSCAERAWVELEGWEKANPKPGAAT